jgi:cysteine desulfuration protein SufE
MTLNDALETLHLLPDWEQRYTYLIELARTLPPMPADEKIPANLVPGCTSQVWLTHHWHGAGEANGEEPTLHFHIDSDALIVKGLMTLVHLAYNGQTRAQIRNLNLAEGLQTVQLLQHLSPNRRNGFASVVSRIQSL